LVTTPEHPFYVPKLGWTSAIKLRAGDILVLSNGEHVVVEAVQHEILESPVKVYNLEVADFIDYFVGDKAILVHNECKGNWADGGRGSGEQNSLDHYDKHGGEVGARDYEDYLRKAKVFANTVLTKKDKGVIYISGYTDGVYRYNYNGKYIDLVFNGIEHLIVSFGRNGDGWY